jgi:hypothetical protein
MALDNFGFASYSGIEAFESFEFCDTSGVRAAVGSMKVFPQYGLPDENGDIVLTYNQNTIVLRNCHIDSIRYVAGSGGQICEVRFLDERWAWENASVSGKYNYRLPNNAIVPYREKTPQELVTLCFKALGVTVFDVSSLPNEARPEVDWDHSNPAQEMERICHELGCRIVPVRSIGGWKVVVIGDGKDLPDFPAQDAGEGIDPQEVPDYIKIVSAPIKYQVSLPLAAIGKDTDLSWKYLNDLSYALDKWLPSGGFGLDGPDNFCNTNPLRFVLPDGTKISKQELAQDTVFRSWRLKFEGDPYAVQNTGGEWCYKFPKIDDPVTIQQIILTNEMVDTWTDYLGIEHKRGAYIWGRFYGKLAEGRLAEYPLGTRIDKQAANSSTSEDERASFSMSLDPIDTNRSIISTSQRLYRQIPALSEIHPLTGIASPLEWVEAQLYLTCACQVRDPKTWQPYRYEHFMQIGNGTNKDFAVTIVKDDIQPWAKTQNIFGGTMSVTNLDEVIRQSQYYAESYARRYQTVRSQQKTFIGLYGIDMDGSINQITWSISGQGSSTIASQGTEHSFYTPDFDARRRQVANRGMAEQMQYMKYEQARKTALLGTSTT